LKVEPLPALLCCALALLLLLLLLLLLPQVFAAAGLQSPVAASIITGGVNLLFTIASAAVMDRCGQPAACCVHLAVTIRPFSVY
jgi:hypothetical protein